MNVVDIAFGLFILVLAIRGLIRGLIKEIFGIGALIGGVIVSNTFGKQFGTTIYHHLTVSPVVAYTFSFFVIFIIFYLVLLLIGYILSNMIKAIQLGWLDRLLGLIFGGFKGLLLIAVLVFAIENFPFLNYLNKDLERSSYIYSAVSIYINKLNIQRFLEKAKGFKKTKIRGLTITIGGYNAKG